MNAPPRSVTECVLLVVPRYNQCTRDRRADRGNAGGASRARCMVAGARPGVRGGAA